MTTYNAGTTTPNLAGSVEIPAFTIGGSTFRVNNGTFELLSAIGLFWGSPTLRDAISPLPADHGAYSGQSFYSQRNILLNGEIVVPTVADMWAAIDWLNQAFNITDPALPALKTLVANTSGWSAKRQLLVKIDGEIQIPEPPDKNGHLATRRRFTVPLVAPDPLMYNADTLQSVTVTTTNLTNNGIAPTPFVVRFNGPRTDPQLDGPGLTGRLIKYIGVIASGHWVEVGTNPAGDGTGLYVVDDLGNNLTGSLDSFTARTIPPGTSSWAVTSSAGAGAVTVSFRDAWL